MNHYDWTFDPDWSNGWFLGEPSSPQSGMIDAWHFKKCQPFSCSVEPLTVPIKRPGAAADASFGAFDLLYVSPRLGAALQLVAGSEMQLLPAVVEGSKQNVFLVNVLREIDCVDEKTSDFTKWEPGNPARPDKAGQYRSFVDLRIDPMLSGNATIFRPWGWHMALIVSEQVKEVVESIGAEGTVFRLVS